MKQELELVSANAGAMMRPDAAPVQLSAPALLAIVERAAKDPACDVDKAERMLGMALKVMAIEAEQKFNAAMAACQSEIPPVLRDAQNPATNSRYTRLETLHEKVMPIATKHGFSMSFGTSDCPVAGNFRVTCVIRHNGGHSTTAQIDLPNDSMGAKGNQNKTLVHGAGSSMSYARRYLTMMIFNVALTNEDDDGNRGAKRKANPADNDSGVRAAAVELWKLLKPVRGTANNWDAANQWLWRNEFLDGGAEEAAPNLPLEKLNTVIAKCAAHPDLKPV